MMRLFNERYAGFGGGTTVADVLPSSRSLHSGNELLLFDISRADIFQRDGLCVNVQPGRDRHQWKLIYAGELLSEDNGASKVGHAVYFPI